MFFTKKQLNTFIKSFKIEDTYSFFEQKGDYLISPWSFPDFFRIICHYVEINNTESITNAISYGKILLHQYDHQLKDVSIHIKNHFFIKKKQYNFFISNILYPLLKIIKERKRYIWQTLPNKLGLWRELEEKEQMPIGSEVSMNFSTGKKWLKM